MSQSPTSQSPTSQSPTSRSHTQSPDPAELEELRFPIGRFELGPSTEPAQRRSYLDRLAAQPAKLQAAVEGLSEAQLVTPYRDGGWTVRQVVHHIADSQMNGYIRCRWLLTEDHATLKPYDENAWAELPDALEAPVEISLRLHEALYRRWLTLLEALVAKGPSDHPGPSSPAPYGTGEAIWGRSIHHPESGDLTLDQMLALYAWHGDHHIAHIVQLRRRRGW